VKNFCWDIETVARPTDELQSIMPAFDPESVKTGNLGPDKAQEKIEKTRTDYFQRYYKRAALSALTGQVALIGVIGASDGDPVIFKGEEAETITAFFEFWNFQTNEGAHWLGFNIKNFDIPFLVRRAWLHRIQVPYGFVKGRYLPAFFTDLMELWTACEHTSQFEVSLNDLALYFGFPPKTANGADFGELLRYKPDDAFEYLRHDLRLTYLVAEAMRAIKYQPSKPESDPELRPAEPESPTEPEPEQFRIQFY